MRLENHRLKNLSCSRTALDWNGNEPEWTSNGSSLVASIKVSPIMELSSVETVTRNRNSNLLQLDGAADSSEAESDVLAVPLTSTSEEPVKCTRCKRSYRTMQSFNKHAETCDEILSSSTSDEELEEMAPLKKEIPESAESNPIQVPIVNSSSQVTIGSSADSRNKTGLAASKSAKTRSRRKPRVSSNTVRRPLAARLPMAAPGIQVVAPQPQQQVRTYHITLPSIPQQQPSAQHVVYVANSGAAEISYPVSQPQQHLLIIPPIEHGIIQTPQLQPSPTVYGTPSFVQYYGPYSSDLLTMGTLNMGVAGLPALIPGMAPVQCHIPWEATNSVNPVIMLPPPPPPSYPLMNTVIPVEQPSFIQIQEAATQDSVQPVLNLEQQEPPRPLAQPEIEEQQQQLEQLQLQEPVAEIQEKQCEQTESVSQIADVADDYDALEELKQNESPDFSDDFGEAGQPPRPTYSYRVAMSTEKKNPLTAALIAAAITTADIDPSDEPSPPFGTQQLKVTAESDEIHRTFHIKATSQSEKPRGPHIVYELTSEDGFHASSSSVTDLWRQLLDAVQDARLAYKLEPLPNSVLTNEECDSLEVLGLNHPALRYLLEQLPNAAGCSNYEFLYHQPEALAPLIGSAFGCSRAAPYSDRTPHDIFNWLASEHRPRPQLDCSLGAELVSSRRATNNELLPMSARFRSLRQTSRYSVGVYRSGIHGRGLFCKRDFDSGEMVVEYAGEIIRSIVSDKREKEYEAKGIGCYMFRIDDQTVVDATLHGNAARFINHSCEPNCYSRIVDVQGKKQIIIFALRRIQRGEELTYDYKFPIEEVKIPCTCGSRRCRKYLN